jgi:hypothetical protein
MSIRTVSKTRPAISPFYFVAGAAIVALSVLGFYVATR